MRIYKYLIMCLLVTTLFCSCGSNKGKNINLDKSKKIEKKSLKISTTNKLLDNMIISMGENKYKIESVVKSGTNQNTFKYTKDTLDKVSKTDLFIYFGAEFEPWVNEFLDKLNKSSINVIDISRGIRLLNRNNPIKYNNSLLRINPYYLLDLDNYKIAMLNIKNALQDKDPENRDFYEENFNQDLDKLKIYENEFSQISQKSKNSIFITCGDDLDYFIRYNKLNNYKLPTKGEDKKVKPDMTDEEKSRIAIEKLANEKDYTDKLKIAEDAIKSKTRDKIIFLYTDPKDLQTYKNIIANTKAQPINIITYSYDKNYSSLLENNIQNLKSIIK